MDITAVITMLDDLVMAASENGFDITGIIVKDKKDLDHIHKERSSFTGYGLFEIDGKRFIDSYLVIEEEKLK